MFISPAFTALSTTAYVSKLSFSNEVFPFAPLIDPAAKPACPLLRETGGLCYADLLLKLLRHILQQLSDGQVLGADALALAAADAVRGVGAGPGVDILIVVVRVPVVVGVLRVHDGEQVGDGDMLLSLIHI